MKKYCLIFAVILFLGSCEKDDLGEENLNEENAVDEQIFESNEVNTTSSEEERPEFFRWKIDDEEYETTEGKHIKGTVYPSPDTGVITFDFSGEIVDNSKEVNFYKGFIFKVCFYDGVGTYYTGTTETVSWAMYWLDYELWENHYSYGNESGIVEVTAATDDYVEGSFGFEAYNPDLETNIYVDGKFKLNLETRTDYDYN